MGIYDWESISYKIHESITNIMFYKDSFHAYKRNGFADPGCLFDQITLYLLTHDMFHKVLANGIPHVAEHCFTNGFLDLSGWPWGVPAPRGGPAAAGSKDCQSQEIHLCKGTLTIFLFEQKRHPYRESPTIGSIQSSCPTISRKNVRMCPGRVRERPKTYPITAK